MPEVGAVVAKFDSKDSGHEVAPLLVAEDNPRISSSAGEEEYAQPSKRKTASDARVKAT